MRRPHVRGAVALLKARREPNLDLRVACNRSHRAPSSPCVSLPLSTPVMHSTAAPPPPPPSLSTSCDGSHGPPVGEVPLASVLFYLLQLRHWTTPAPLPAAGAVAAATPRTRSTGTPTASSDVLTPVLAEAARLRGEVRAVGDVLRAHRRSCSASPTPTAPSASLPPRRGRQGDSGAAPSRDRTADRRRSPLQPTTVPTDGEEAWLLLPLQRAVVEGVLCRLRVLERALARCAVRGGAGADSGSVTDPRLAAEVQDFFDEEVRVAAELVALRGAHEQDAQSLEVLVHVQTAAANAGVSLPVERLVSAASAAAATATSAAATQPSHRRGERGGASWRSCVPWLLTCYGAALTPSAALGADARAGAAQPATQGDDSDGVRWSTASAWMTAAADRVCATPTAELLLRLAPPAGAAASSDTGAPARPQESARTHPFEPWQRVLDAEADSSAAPPSGTSLVHSDGDASRRGATDKWLLTWFAERAAAHMPWEVDSGSLGVGGSTWRVYWLLVVRGMVVSGGRAVEELLALRRGASAPRRHDAHVAEVQFHAVGSYVSLRRITSFLQHHRRLVPLLQLHALASGCAGQPAQPDRLPSSGSSSSGPSHRAAGHGADAVSMAAAAARWRRCVLAGVLLQPPPAASTAQDTRHHQRRRRADGQLHSSAPPHGEAGVMLWREVALLDAYTLITLGHVSERAIDGAEVDRHATLRYVAWLQEECAGHLVVLGGLREEQADAASSACGTADEDAAPRDRGAPPVAMSHARRAVLLQHLTPRTHAALVAKLREGLRLSTKVLVRWGTPEHICRLHLRYPSMGPSWEVGRAMLQCGQYGAAVEVLQGLLQVGDSSSSTAAPLSRSSSGAAAVRQLLLEAMEGAAVALLLQSQEVAGGVAATAGRTSDVGSVNGEEEEEVPLPAELRTRLHSLHAHLRSLPVPLPLCLHAVMRGLASPASAGADASTTPSHRTHSPPRLVLGLRTSAEERARTSAVLCTYLLRRHLAQDAGEGLLSATVELWASTAAPYLGRRCTTSHGGDADAASASAASSRVPQPSLQLSATDTYIRAVAARLLHGYPQLPVARLLLSRLVQLTTAPTPSSPRPPTDAGANVLGEPVAVTASDARVALSVAWLLGLLYAPARAPELSSAHPTAGPAAPLVVPVSLAYRLCVPATAAVAATVHAGEAPSARQTMTEPPPPPHPAPRLWWNAGFTQRYALDTLSLMPRIAVECVERLMRQLEALHAVSATATSSESIVVSLERVTAVAARRRAVEEQQRQPWQCSTCLLWNSRHARTCRRCSASSTVLLQCSACRCLTSSAGDRADVELHCDVCAALLASPTPSSPASMVAATATVTGTGRTAARYSTSTAIARVVPLRPWTCTHCRTANEPHHVFFCRGCGRASTDTAKCEAVAAAGDADGVCTCCGYRPGPGDTPLLPWCHRCGALRARIQALQEKPASGGLPASLPTVGAPASQPHAPFLWWCAECTTALNPWTRTHCDVCGAGRPAAAAGAVEAAQEAVACLPAHTASPSSLDAWNTAAPLVAVRWQMHTCLSCKSQTRVGQSHCWSCHAPLVWPPEVRQAVVDGWHRWVSQVAHVVVGDAGAVGADAADAVLQVRHEVTRWVCLRDGCMHVNHVTAGAADCSGGAEAEAASAATARDGQCAACAYTRRRPAHALDPVVDRFAWRAASLTAAQVVEAVVLPDSAPRPGDVIDRSPERRDAGGAAADGPVLISRRECRGSSAAALCPACGARGTRAATSDAAAMASRCGRRLFMVEVCDSCGWCVWGRSSCAYDAPDEWVGDAVCRRGDAPPLPLPPGEHAMALRLLLKALQLVVHEAVAVERPEVSSAAAVRRPLDWAWLSRFVLSGVRLLTSSVAEGQLHVRAAWGGDPHERLPWRGCDIASAQHACAAEPRIPVLESDAGDGGGGGTVHSAILHVRHVVEGVCDLVEHRVRRAVPRAAPSRHRTTVPLLPPSLQDVWTRRLLVAALDLIDVVNASTVYDEIGYHTLQRLCLLLRPAEAAHIQTETKWMYLHGMKLSRRQALHGCVQCEQCLTNHGPTQPCAP
ncbi:hypothetical protein NESM_000727800 [Novymonas esmeraldas]|uniref:RanBP2-type domain-containing protein n=1 Tax=Novymonas esmeraldas TaxID=1808958 RepID=A0AAW0EVJ4_9TRYP